MRRLILAAVAAALVLAGTPAGAQFPPPSPIEEHAYVLGAGVGIACGDPGVGKTCFDVVGRNRVDIAITDASRTDGIAGNDLTVGGTYAFYGFLGRTGGGVIGCDGRAEGVMVPVGMFGTQSTRLEVMPGGQPCPPNPGSSTTASPVSASGKVTVHKF